MAFDDQDRVNHTDTENRSEEHPTAEGTQQKNEEAESSGLYRMTREDLKNSTPVSYTHLDVYKRQ